MSEECNHSFKVEKVCEGLPLCQVLLCKRCNKKFLGWDGKVGKPNEIHEIRQTMTTEAFEGVLLGGKKPWLTHPKL